MTKKKGRFFMVINGKLFIRVSKSKKGTKYYALSLDLGYVVKFLCFNVQDIAEICNISVRDIYALDYGDYAVSLGK